jgi:membrane associated rhomboid family serine protease
MANCTSCGRELPAFSTGRLSTLCRECQATENSAPPIPSVVPTYKGSSAISLTYILVGINVAVFALMTLTGVPFLSPTSAQLLKWGANWGPLSLTTQPWRILTSNYVHIGIIHIGFNMWCLLNLGALAQRIFDRWTYVLIYTATGIAGSIASLWWHPTVVGAGASGAIFGLAGALISALYLGKLPIPKEAIQATMKSLLIFAAYNLFFGLTQGIDNAAHIGGLASGLALGALLSKHLTGPAEVRQQWRNLASVLSIVLLSAGMYYVRHQHTELAAVVNPSDYFDQYEKAMDAFRQKDYAKAVEACQKMVQSNPSSAEAHFLLGVAYETTENPDGAIPQYQEALRLNPRYSEAAAGLSEAYKSKGMDRESKEAAHKAVELKGAH